MTSAANRHAAAEELSLMGHTIAKPSRSWGYGASKEYLQRFVTERASTFPLYAARAQEILDFLARQERRSAEWAPFRVALRQATWVPGVAA